MALVSERCSSVISSTLVLQNVNRALMDPNKVARSLIPQQRKHFSGVSYMKRCQMEKKMLQTKGTVRASPEEASEWSKKDNRRFLHAVFRVTELERSIKFYTEVFGMTVWGRRDLVGEKAAIVGFGPPESNFVLELIYRSKFSYQLLSFAYLLILVLGLEIAISVSCSNGSRG